MLILWDLDDFRMRLHSGWMNRVCVCVHLVLQVKFTLQAFKEVPPISKNTFYTCSVCVCR